MKPRNKVERAVVKLSTNLPQLSDKQQAWAIKTCVRQKDAYEHRDRFARGCFYLVVTFKGWQVLRYFQVRAKFRYHKLVGDKVYFKECMQHWMKNGKYVFLSKQRFCGYISDAFCSFGNLEVRTNTQWGVLGDPRELGWDGVYYASVQDKYKYALRDFGKQICFDDIFRSVNAHPYNETLMRGNFELWKVCRYHGAVFDKILMSSVRVVIRHGHADYIYYSLWWDMVDSLRYLKKDLSNPIIVCPPNLKEAHDKWIGAAQSRKRKMADQMEKLRQIQEERRMLAYMEEQAKRDKENKQKAKALASVYIARRKQFFDLDIANGVIHIKVLRSVEEFFEEGKEMCHCVFANGYYDVNKKPNCLILSAKVNGQRMETLEVDLSSFKVVQCQGKRNVNSAFHDSILNLVRENMWQIKSCATKTKRNKTA